MIEIKIKTANPYSALIGENCLPSLGRALLSVEKPSKILVVTDDNVSGFYLEAVTASLKEAGFDVFSFVMESGEQNKNISTYTDIINALSENLFSREDMLLSLGGGVVGDITGFAASTYMRGVSYANVPTTLLAMLDASVGGKTAIDTKLGKNLIGTFWQPSLVFIDTQILKTLPEKEIKNGLGEAVKYAVLSGGEILSLLTYQNCATDFTRLVTLCLDYKKEIVEDDERESGKRALLNLGHTVGHAAEVLSGFSVNHGEAVVKGIYKLASAQLKERSLGAQDFEKIAALAEKFHFDITLPFSAEALVSAVAHDKKLTGSGNIKLVEIVKIGECRIREISLTALEKFLR